MDDDQKDYLRHLMNLEFIRRQEISLYGKEISSQFSSEWTCGCGQVHGPSRKVDAQELLRSPEQREKQKQIFADLFEQIRQKNEEREQAEMGKLAGLAEERVRLEQAIASCEEVLKLNPLNKGAIHSWLSIKQRLGTVLGQLQCMYVPRLTNDQQTYHPHPFISSWGASY